MKLKRCTAVLLSAAMLFLSLPAYADAANSGSDRLVEGSVYSVNKKNVVTGVAANTTAAEFRSNFINGDQVKILDSSGNQLDDEALVVQGTKAVYDGGQSYAIGEIKGDLNQDGTIDVRDLKIAKSDMLSNATSGDQVLTEWIRGQILCTKSPQTKSIGARQIMQMCNPVGRCVMLDEAMYLENSAANFTISGSLTGDVELTLKVHKVQSDECGMFVEVDGIMSYYKLDTYEQYVTVRIANGLTAGDHVIQISKSTDSKNDGWYVSAVHYSGELVKTEPAERYIEFLGDSITAGYGVYPSSKGYGQTHSYFTYANRTADALGADYYSVANGGWVLCRDANPSMAIANIYTKQSMYDHLGLGEYEFERQPDVVVINLGTNDRGGRTDFQLQNETEYILKLVREKNPDATIIYAYGMMDASAGNIVWISAAVERFAQSDGNTYYVALPENTAGVGAHPNYSGSIEAGQVLTDAIKSIMGW